MVRKRKRIADVRMILGRLRTAYPHPGPFVEWSNALELVIGTVLSAQCTDVQVNKVTKSLFKKYRTVRQYANARLPVLEKEIYSTGFYRSKARYLKGIGQRLVEAYDGKVPDRFEDLMTLPGVSRKSANLIMAKAFGQPTGVAVDTHVSRLAPRLGFTKRTDPKRIEQDLNSLTNPRDYLALNELFIMHGRAVCVALPHCDRCVLSDLCPSSGTFRRYSKGRRPARSDASRRSPRGTQGRG